MCRLPAGDFRQSVMSYVLLVGSTMTLSERSEPYERSEQQRAGGAAPEAFFWRASRILARSGVAWF